MVGSAAPPLASVVAIVVRRGERQAADRQSAGPEAEAAPPVPADGRFVMIRPEPHVAQPVTHVNVVASFFEQLARAPD